MRAKTYSFLINDGSEDKKAKATNKCVIKGKRKAEEAQLENKINHLGKNKNRVDSLQEDHKQFLKNKPIFKTHKYLEVESIGFLLQKLI